MQKCFGHVRHRHAEGFKVSRTWYTYIQLLKSHDNELRLNDQTCIKVSIFGLSGDDMNEAC